MRVLRTVLLLLLVAALAFLGARLGAGRSQAQQETALQRVLRTGIIRCGYTPYSVGLIKDPNTGTLSGIYYDVMQHLGANLSLKVQYVEEVGWGQQIEGLKAGRFDMVCSPVSLTGTRSHSADFSLPLFYSPAKLWGRRDDAKLANATLETLNQPGTRIAVIDGEQSVGLAQQFLPKATLVTLPQTASFAELLQQVTDNKADLVISEPYSVKQYMEANPEHALAELPLPALATQANIFLLPQEQAGLKALIDNGLRELANSGLLDRIISQYEKFPGSYVRVPLPR